jgi:hypothetical protein
MHVIHIIARADGVPDATVDGLFLKDFDPDAYDGRGLITTTEDRRRARRFNDLAAAWNFWNTETATGKPLTAYTVTFEPHNQEADPVP